MNITKSKNNMQKIREQAPKSDDFQQNFDMDSKSVCF